MPVANVLSKYLSDNATNQQQTWIYLFSLDFPEIYFFLTQKFILYRTMGLFFSPLFFSIFTISHPASFLSFVLFQVRQTVKTKEILFLEGENCNFLCASAHAQLCPTLCNPMDFNSLGSSVHGVLQARILEWLAISYSRGSSLPSGWTHVSCIGRWILLPLKHLGKPQLSM